MKKTNKPLYILIAFLTVVILFIFLAPLYISAKIEKESQKSYHERINKN